MADHDFRTHKGDAGVELIVRPRNRYGEALPGESVLVDTRELANGATRAACMTAEEAADLQRLLAKQQAEQDQRRRVASRTSVATSIADGIARLKRKDEKPEERKIDAAMLAAAEENARRASASLLESTAAAASEPKDDEELPAPKKSKKAKG